MISWIARAVLKYIELVIKLSHGSLVGVVLGIKFGEVK